jgi:hypothetical protein
MSRKKALYHSVKYINVTCLACCLSLLAPTSLAS